MAMIVDESLVNGRQLYEKDPFLKKFITCASGYGTDEKGSYAALVIVHDNANLAQENIQLLKQRINDSILPTDNSASLTGTSWVKSNKVILDLDIQSNGNILIAKLYTKDKDLLYRLLTSYNGILFHEQ